MRTILILSDCNTQNRSPCYIKQALEVLEYMEKNDFILCPLVDREIDIVDCMENRAIKEDFIPAEYKVKPNWKDICAVCPFSKY